MQDVTDKHYPDGDVDIMFSTDEPDSGDYRFVRDTALSEHAGDEDRWYALTSAVVLLAREVRALRRDRQEESK